MNDPEILVCPICQTPQHVISVGTKEIFLGCGHAMPKEEPEEKPYEEPSENPDS